MSFTRNVALAAILVLSSSRSNAAVITETFSFSLGGFVDVRSTSTPPVATVSGVFTITFDPTVDGEYEPFFHFGISPGYALTNVSISGVNAAPYAFDYQVSTRVLSFGGALAGAAGVVGGGDLGLEIYLPVSGPPTFVTCANRLFECGGQVGRTDYSVSGYTGSGNSSFFIASVGASSLSVTVPMTVPEPRSGSLLGLGAAALVLLGRMVGHRAHAATVPQRLA